MKEMKQVSKDNYRQVVEEFNYVCRFTDVAVTLNKLEADEDDLDLDVKMIDPIQYVVAVGPSVHDISVGDKVFLDLEKLMVKSYSSRDSDQVTFELNIVPINVGEDFEVAVINDRIIKLIVK